MPIADQNAFNKIRNPLIVFNDKDVHRDRSSYITGISIK
jgi:hypothetical protein